MTSASASRVTRSRRHLQLVLLLSAATVSTVGVLRAQDAPVTPATTKPAAPATTGQDTASAQGAPARAEEGASTGAANPPAPKGPSPARFEPTEKVRADFDVSFPIDI